MSQANKAQRKREKKKNPYSKCRSNCAAHKFTFKPKEDSLYHPSATINYCPLYSE
jgi:hypothetical protein